MRARQKRRTIGFAALGSTMAVAAVVLGALASRYSGEIADAFDRGRPPAPIVSLPAEAAPAAEPLAILPPVLSEAPPTGVAAEEASDVAPPESEPSANASAEEVAMTEPGGARSSAAAEPTAEAQAPRPTKLKKAKKSDTASKRKKKGSDQKKKPETSDKKKSAKTPRSSAAAKPDRKPRNADDS
jgi:hypothetical protein